MRPRPLRRATLLPALFLALPAFSERAAFAQEARPAAPEPAAAAAPATPATTTPSPPAPALVVVDSTRPFTVLERRANGVAGWSLTLPFPAYVSTTQWEPVCVAPCELHLDPNGVYRVGGGGVSSSSPFVVPRSPDPVRLHVHAGSSFWRDAGTVLGVLGAGSVVVGIAIAGESNAVTNPGPTLRAGVAFFAPGVLAMILGATLRVTNGSSVVTDDGKSL